MREISRHIGIFSGRFPILTDGIFPPCRNFSDHIPGYKPQYRKALSTGQMYSSIGFHPAFKILTGPFLYFSSVSVPPPPSPSFSVFAAAILAQSGFIATTNMEVLYLHTHTVAPVFAPVEVLFKAHLFQAYELIYPKYRM
jgi:hypothetical protein